MYEWIPTRINSDGTLKHIARNGARYHVKWWNSNGIHCSEKKCEINKKEEKK